MRSYDSTINVLEQGYFLDEFVYTQMSEKHTIYISKAKFCVAEEVVKPEQNVSYYTFKEQQLVNITKYNDRLYPVFEKFYAKNLIIAEKHKIGINDSEISYSYNDEVLHEIVCKLDSEINYVIQFQFDERARIKRYVKTNFFTGISDTTIIKPVYR